MKGWATTLRWALVLERCRGDAKVCPVCLNATNQGRTGPRFHGFKPNSDRDIQAYHHRGSPTTPDNVFSNSSPVLTSVSAQRVPSQSARFSYRRPARTSLDVLLSSLPFSPRGWGDLNSFPLNPRDGCTSVALSLQSTNNLSTNPFFSIRFGLNL